MTTNILDNIKLDEDGFLAQRSDWNKDVAQAFAQQENIELTKEHWEIIEQVQNYFDAFDLSPEMRPLIKYLKQNVNAEINSIYLLKLFPGSPAKLSSKIAGLPKPDNCI